MSPVRPKPFAATGFRGLTSLTLIKGFRDEGCFTAAGYSHPVWSEEHGGEVYAPQVKPPRGRHVAAPRDRHATDVRPPDDRCATGVRLPRGHTCPCPCPCPCPCHVWHVHVDTHAHAHATCEMYMLCMSCSCGKRGV